MGGCSRRAPPHVEEIIKNRTINPNLLVNSNFKNPINTSGRIEWISDPTKNKFNIPQTIQCWYPRDSMTNVILKEDCVRIEFGEYASNSTADGRGFSQELDRRAIEGKTITASFKIKDISAKWLFRPNGNTASKYLFSNAIDEEIYQPIIDAPGEYSFTFNIKKDLSAYPWITIGFYTAHAEVYNNADIEDFIEIEWIKLELGDKATPLESDYDKLNLLKNDQVQLLLGGENILNNQDLNNYTSIGNYYCPDNDIVKTLKNKSNGLVRAFTLTVKSGVGQINDPSGYNYYVQTIETYSGETFKRSFYIVNGVYTFYPWISDTPLPVGTVVFNTIGMHNIDDSWIPLDRRWLKKSDYPELEKIIPFGMNSFVQNSLSWVSPQYTLTLDGYSTEALKIGEGTKGWMYITPDETEMVCFLDIRDKYLHQKQYMLRSTDSGATWKGSTINLGSHQSSDSYSLRSQYCQHVTIQSDGKELFVIVRVNGERYIDIMYTDKRNDEHNISFSNGISYDTGSTGTYLTSVANTNYITFCLLSISGSGYRLIRTTTGPATYIKVLTLPPKGSNGEICGMNNEGKFMISGWSEYVNNSKYNIGFSILNMDTDTWVAEPTIYSNVTNSVYQYDMTRYFVSFYDKSNKKYVIISLSNKNNDFGSIHYPFYYEVRTFTEANPQTLTFAVKGSFAHTASGGLGIRSNSTTYLFDETSQYFILATHYSGLPYLIIKKETYEVCSLTEFYPSYYGEKVVGYALQRSKNRLYGLRVWSGVDALYFRGFSYPYKTIDDYFQLPYNSFLTSKGTTNDNPPVNYGAYDAIRRAGGQWYIKGR